MKACKKYLYDPMMQVDQRKKIPNCFELSKNIYLLLNLLLTKKKHPNHVSPPFFCDSLYGEEYCQKNLTLENVMVFQPCWQVPGLH